MYKFPIGILMESLREDDKTAIASAAAMGVKGMQLHAVRGNHSPEEMTAERKKELLDMMKSNGLCFSALCGDLGEGFWRPERNPILIEKSKRMIDMGLELETNIVTTHIGVVPSDPNHDRYKIMQEACFELSRYADSMNAHFAIETGPETAVVLKNFLDSLGSTGVAVNLDPANLVMVTGDDPVQAVYTLKDYIVHTHAKDGIKLFDVDPEIIYRVIEDEREVKDRPFREVPLGEGKVDFDNYLKALEDIGYKGYLTIEREVGDNPKADIENAVKFLEGKLEVL
ncbi:MAG: sugar phosphate isomerase/epimerase [Clostridia bacterium]|nr:sugar phosphate isomerase/epimerase [Clostridia bacterium]